MPRPAIGGTSAATRPCFYTTGYGLGSDGATGHLRALANAGLVERFKMGRAVYWRWIGEPVEIVGIAGIEATA